MENLVNQGGIRPLMSPVELQEGIASLSRGAYFKEASLDMMLSILTESAANMSGVARASIWALGSQHEDLLCLDLFELASRRHSKGQRVHASQYPSYFSALRAGNCISADDAYIHPLTAEFALDYLPRHGVTAMLDTPIHIRGELQGVLCLEQVGTRQPWTSAHALFAQAVANLVTLALVEYEAGEAKLQALAAGERLKAVCSAI
ncbi:MAG: GAF domain-containing protein [Gammaproteobacteria bacterium]|nr:GAF domain-containing protein [Gammaproteobacteria bacterium]MBU1603602.1 GAF domain-containing protein [Gammaproteobacteria bacterium]MBU2432399.1 GAF domain-containing protein [Gammaproteobacteria bacterium]MBU2447741.1 GAF domain-containing protein [Gammaproteobacteria bacterium]